MLAFRTKYNRPYTVRLLVAMSMACFSLSLFRAFYTDSLMFLFLNWNLFLAFVPWAFSVLIVTNEKLQKSKLMLVALLCVWLLFFPNAPYILTDLFHLRLRTQAPIWFDLALILSFAWTGLFFGFTSLFDIERLLAKLVGKRTLVVILILLLFLASFGIYVGRYLRWNSWDIISEPLGLLYDIGDRLANPLSYPRTWGMTILMGVVLNMIYWSLKAIKAER